MPKYESNERVGGWVEIERYELGPVIGTGAFASVYRARDPRLDAPVAVKVLADNWSADPSVRFRFGQEASLLRRIRSERRDAPLVEVFDIDEGAGGRPYFVMSYADRGTLKDRMDGRPRPPGQVADVVDALANGMTALHRSGVIHRDLKPSNLLYVSTGSAVDGEQLLIGDLGLAKDQLATGSALTLAGGSPGYMAPEQAVGQANIGPQADIHAASVIVLELLTGRRDLDALALLPARLSAALERGTSVTPGDRHRSAEEWRTELSDALTAAELLSAPAPDGPPSTGDPSAVTELGFGGPDMATAMREPGPVGGVDRLGDEATAASGRRRSWIAAGVVAAVATVAVLVGGLAFFGLVLNGGDAVAVRGPSTASVGQTIVLGADVPDGGSYSWIVDDTSVDGQDLRLTPRSSGSLLVRLEHRDGTGAVSQVTHVVEVTP